MSSVLTRLAKPEYLFRPTQLFRRARISALGSSNAVHAVGLPWGHQLFIDPGDVVGRALTHLGVYELAVSEVIWRLLEPGGMALDIGANAGYVTSLLAFRGGPHARVLAFEPHPANFTLLEKNVTLWSGRGCASVEVRREAVGDVGGKSELVVPEAFSQNAGLAYLAQAVFPGSPAGSSRIPVKVIRLDDLLPTEQVSLMKVDVEGAELNVFRGAERLLSEGRVRDIVFEAHPNAERTLVEFLEALGYRCLRIERSLLHPRVGAIGAPRRSSRWEPPNLLATRDARRAIALCSGWGWRVLGA